MVLSELREGAPDYETADSGPSETEGDELASERPAFAAAPRAAVSGESRGGGEEFGLFSVWFSFEFHEFSHSFMRLLRRCRGRS